MYINGSIIFDTGVTSLAAAELEVVVLCKLGLASISQQRHHSCLAAKAALAAMRMVQEAEVFLPQDERERIRK